MGSWRTATLAKFVSEDRIVELFKKLGFGGLDARVYITLLSGAPLTISGLLGELEVYRLQLHDSLNRLLAKGFVEVNKGKPTLYRAVDPEVVLETFSGSSSYVSWRT